MTGPLSLGGNQLSDATINQTGAVGSAPSQIIYGQSGLSGIVVGSGNSKACVHIDVGQVTGCLANNNVPGTPPCYDSGCTIQSNLTTVADANTTSAYLGQLVGPQGSSGSTFPFGTTITGVSAGVSFTVATGNAWQGSSGAVSFPLIIGGSQNDQNAGITIHQWSDQGAGITLNNYGSGDAIFSANLSETLAGNALNAWQGQAYPGSGPGSMAVGNAINVKVWGLGIGINVSDGAKAGNAALVNLSRSNGTDGIYIDILDYANNSASLVNLFQNTQAYNGNMVVINSEGIKTGFMVNLRQEASTFSGTGLRMTLADGTGSFTGYFIECLNNTASKFSVDSSGTVVVASTLQANSGAQLNGYSTLYAGSGVPSSGTGSNGDFYFRQNGTSGNHIYFKSSGSWTALV